MKDRPFICSLTGADPLNLNGITEEWDVSNKPCVCFACFGVTGSGGSGSSGSSGYSNPNQPQYNLSAGSTGPVGSLQHQGLNEGSNLSAGSSDREMRCDPGIEDRTPERGGGGGGGAGHHRSSSNTPSSAAVVAATTPSTPTERKRRRKNADDAVPSGIRFPTPHLTPLCYSCYPEDDTRG